MKILVVVMLPQCVDDCYAVKECDATGFDSSKAARYKKNYFACGGIAINLCIQH